MVDSPPEVVVFNIVLIITYFGGRGDAAGKIGSYSPILGTSGDISGDNCDNSDDHSEFKGDGGGRV